MKWILGGAIAALLPLAFSLYLAVARQSEFGGGAATWPMFCASLFVTVAFTISITRYRLMELDKIVSSGFAYFAISLLAALGYYGLVFGGVLLLGSRITPSIGHALVVGTTVLILMIVLDLARGRLKKVLDRHFRREKHQLDRTLQRMSQAIAQLVDPPTLARRLLHTTTDLLDVERGAVYLREGDPPLYRLADSVGDLPPLSELSPGCPLVEELLTQESLQHRSSLINGTPLRPALRQLQFLGGEVAHALTHEGHMLAILLLGPKKHGPYTEEDFHLLTAFAQVTVLALVSGEEGRIIESLNQELQAKVEKIAEQQRRILALQGDHFVVPGPRLAKLALQLGDVRLIALERRVDPVDLGPQPFGHVGGLLTLDQRRLGEVLAVLRQRQLGLLGPALLKLVEATERPAHFLAVGDAARRRGADFDQGLLHLEDDHPDHLRRILRTVEQLGDVGGENVPCSGKDTHSSTPAIQK